MFGFMTKPLAQRVQLARALRRLARKQDGASAVEFGLIAAPFLFLILAIMETALVLFAGQTLETAVADTGRLIMTGQAQADGLNQTTFKQAVCARLQGGLFNCDAVYIDVQTKPTFGGFDRDLPFADGKFQPDKVGFHPGGPGDIVLVRAFYQWPALTAIVSGGERVLVATAAFRNEPFAAAN
jgi:Flp pilus assembly protein TadG